MSNDVIIRVEGLGKSYRIRHQAERQRYTALRDVIGDWVKGIFRRRPPVTCYPPPVTSVKPRSLSPVSSTETFWALRDINFEVRQGEVVGIIGRNGAGKSTLLKILSRITDPTQGRITLKGRVASLLEVGTGFHPELTGRENIFLNGAILGMTRAEIRKKFDEIVAFAEVERFLDTPVKRYSSGMYVRLAFAVAAHLEPEILVVDEVLAVGDAEFQKKCLGKMGEAAKGGRTVLFVSHNMAAITALCTKAVLFSEGRIVLESVPTEATRAYLTAKPSQMVTHKGVNGCSASRGGLAIHDFTVQLQGDGIEHSHLLIFCSIESSEPRKYIGFGIAIKTMMGIVVSELAPKVTNFVIHKLDRRVRIKIRIPQILKYLGGGQYLLDAWISVPRVEVLLMAEAIAQFTLMPTDPFGTGCEFKYEENGIVPLPAVFEQVES